MNLIDVTKAFGTEEACLDFLEHLRWPSGVRCIKCDSDNLSRIERKSRGKNKRTRLFQCLNCDYQFTPTTGTIFADSHLPLTKWFLAIGLMLNAKKGISAKQMQRDLGTGYQTAWYLCHRIRKAMEEGELPKFTGTIEADETYVGGRYDPRRKRARREKIPVMGIIQRRGKVRAFPIARPTSPVLVGKIKEHVSEKAELVITDEWAGYKRLNRNYTHRVINHIETWVRGNIHTNSIENFWSLFKRGLIGSFHKVTAKHLPGYLAEFTYRFNRREEENLFIQTLARLVVTIGMPHRELVTGRQSRSATLRACQNNALLIV